MDSEFWSYEDVCVDGRIILKCVIKREAQVRQG